MHTIIDELKRIPERDRHMGTVEPKYPVHKRVIPIAYRGEAVLKVNLEEKKLCTQ